MAERKPYCEIPIPIWREATCSMRVRFVEDQEVVREKITFLAFLLFLRAAEKHEEQSVIDHHQVRREETFPRLLEKAARILSAGFGRADVGFAANLSPDFGIGLNW